VQTNLLFYIVDRFWYMVSFTVVSGHFTSG